MQQFLSPDALLEFMLAIGLSAAAGFRVFVPLLVLSCAAIFGHVDLPTDADWLESPQALVLFAIACGLEILGYYIPWFDHVLDIVATPAAVVSGTIVAASLAPDMNPVAQWTLAFIAGGGTAGLSKGLTNLLRLGSTAISGGLTNPLLATLELAIAVGLSVLAIAVPLAAGVVVLGLLLWAVSQLRRLVVRPAPD